MQSFLLVTIRDLISTGPRQRAATVNIWFYLNYTTWDLLKPWLKHLSCKNAHSWKRTDMQSWCLCSLAVCELSYMWTCYPCETLTLIVKLITFHHFLFVKKKKSVWPDLFWNMLEADELGYEHKRQFPLFLSAFCPFCLFICTIQTCYISQSFAAAGWSSATRCKHTCLPCDSLSLLVRMCDVTP